MAYDVGGRGDQSFNDSAAAGLEKAKDELGCDLQGGRRRQPASPTPPGRSGCSTLADAGYNPIVAVGFVYATSVDQGRQGQYPDVKFAIVDERRPTPRAPTSTRSTFAENRAPTSSASRPR